MEEIFRLENGVQIINQLDKTKFQKFLQHIKDNSSSRTKNEMFTVEESTALERVFKLESDQVTLLIKVTLYILERLSRFVMRPSNIHTDLTNKLKMSSDKAEVFISFWRNLMKIISEEFNVKNFAEIDQIVEPSWQLNLALSSHLNKKEKETTILLDMKSVQNSPKSTKMFVEMSTAELLSFNNQLEAVQLELDSIIKSYN